MRWSNINELCDIVRETSFAIHKYHRYGHLEKVYENALAHRLRTSRVFTSTNNFLSPFSMRMVFRSAITSRTYSWRGG